MKIILYGTDQFDHNISEEIEVSENGDVTVGRLKFKYLGSIPNNWIDVDGIINYDENSFINK